MTTDLQVLQWAADLSQLSPPRQAAYLRGKAAEIERENLAKTADHDAEPRLISEFCHQVLKRMDQGA